MLKKYPVIFGIILLLQPVFLAGQVLSNEQANSLFPFKTECLTMSNPLLPENEADIMAGQAAAFTGKSNTNILYFRDSVNEIFNKMIKSGYSQPQEFEADTLMLKLLADAGYSPNGLLEILNRLTTVQGRQSGGIFNTHSSPAQRIANVEGQIFLYGVTDTRRFREDRFKRIMKK